MNKNILIVFLLFQGLFSGAQDLLTTDEAVRISLEHNYGIQMARNATLIAKNNTSRLNTGELPSVRLSSGANYGMTGSEINYHSESTPSTSVWVGHGLDVNAILSGTYLLYDFNGRKLQKERLQENLAMAELEERLAMEQNIMATLISYYNIAQLQENLYAQEDVLAISRDRKQRAEYQFEFGKSNRLSVLNAQVDINRDSIDYLNLLQQLKNEKRDLNLLLGRDIETSFRIDTSVQFKTGLTLDQLLTRAIEGNTELLLAEQDIQLGKLDIAVNKTALKPQISATSSLGLFGGLNDDHSQVRDQFITDFAAGLSLSWNIFDGGYNKVRNDNLKVVLDNMQVLQSQKMEQLSRDIRNAWESYQNQLYILKVEKNNIETAQMNFSRTEEQFRLGQVSSVEFRQAQLNILYARVNYNRAKFIAKINEIRLLQLSGNVLESL